jgi:hypothetical protein
MGFIYKITNTINGKCYIGETKIKNPLHRWCNHKSSIRAGKGCPALRNSFIKYGEHSFTFEILRECPDEHRIAIEEYYIEQYDSVIPNGYNISHGGQQGGTFAGHKHSEETKIKQAQTIRDLYRNTSIYDCNKGRPCASRKQVSSYDFNGNLVKTYNSILEAAKDVNITDPTIHKCLSNKRNQAGGYMWAYGSLVQINSKYITTNTSNKHPVVQYDLHGNTIAEFESVSEAARETNTYRSSLVQMLSGKSKTAGGFTWKYKS